MGQRGCRFVGWNDVFVRCWVFGRRSLRDGFRIPVQGLVYAVALGTVVVGVPLWTPVENGANYATEQSGVGFQVPLRQARCLLTLR